MPDSREAAIAASARVLPNADYRARILDAAHAAGHILWADDWEQLDEPVHHRLLRHQERLAELNRERQEAETRRADAERRLDGARVRLVALESIVRKLVNEPESHPYIQHYVDLDFGVMDLHLDHLTAEEMDVLRNFQQPTDKETDSDG